MKSFTAGEVVHTTFVCRPSDDSIVGLDDVTCTVANLDTGDSEAVTPQTDGDNSFYADFGIPDDAVDGIWRFKWKSHPPSATIERNNRRTSFYVSASRVPDPA